MSKRQFKITKELEAKCDAPNQFERFDNLFKAIISAPHDRLRKKSARGKKRNTKHRA